jgi:hypothetical protein
MIEPWIYNCNWQGGCPAWEWAPWPGCHGWNWKFKSHHSIDIWLFIFGYLSNRSYILDICFMISIISLALQWCPPSTKSVGPIYRNSVFTVIFASCWSAHVIPIRSSVRFHWLATCALRFPRIPMHMEIYVSYFPPRISLCDNVSCDLSNEFACFAYT